MHRLIPVALGVFALGFGVSIMAQPAADTLPAGPGHDTMVRVCSECHSPDIVADQRMTADGWHDLVEQMAGMGAQASDAELEEIAAYLARSFPATPAAAPGS